MGHKCPFFLQKLIVTIHDGLQSFCDKNCSSEIDYLLIKRNKFSLSLNRKKKLFTCVHTRIPYNNESQPVGRFSSEDLRAKATGPEVILRAQKIHINS